MGRSHSRGPGVVRATTKHWRWRALGLEASARWACAALLLAAFGTLGAQHWATRWRGSLAALANSRPDPLQARSSVLDGAADLGWLALGITLAFIAAAVLSALVTRQVGARRVGARTARRISAPPPARMGLAALVVGGALLGCWGVVAGAARGVAASEQGLQLLYSSWLPYTLVLLAFAFALISVAETWLARRALARAVQTFAEAQAEGAT